MTFSGLSFEFLWTLSELSQDFLRTFPGLSHSQNFVITSQNSLRSFPGVSHGFLRTFHKFLIAFSKLSQDFLRTSSGICQDFPGRSVDVSTAFYFFNLFTFFFFKAFLEHSKDFLRLEQAMVSAVLAHVLCIGISIRTRQESQCPMYAGFSYLFYQPVCQAVFQCKFTARLNKP